MVMRGKLLVVLADGGHARFVRPRADNVLRTETAFDSPSAHKLSTDLGSDRPGASFHSDASARHSLSPRHDLHAMEKDNFAHLVAAELNAAANARTYDELVIVAPAHMQTAIVEKLLPDIAAKIVARLDKDLLKTPDEGLWPHVREWVRPAHRAVS